MIDDLRALAAAVRDAVRPWVVELRGAEIVSENAHGDATFGLDAVAERAIETHLAHVERPVAVYSESAGVRQYGQGAPETLLVVDPVDGTRNATCGFEGCMVSVAAAPFRPDATLGDVEHGVLLDIVGTREFTATRGRGLTMHRDGRKVTRPPSEAPPRARWRWTLNFPARPAALLTAVMGELIDETSLTGSFHVCNSTTFSLTRLVTGQLHAHADIADRIYVEHPASAAHFRSVGATHLTGSQPYDLAACALVLEEAGGVVTDAWGAGLDDRPLLATGADAMLSTVAAAHPAVHAELLAYITAHLPRVAAALDAAAQTR